MKKKIIKSVKRGSYYKDVDMLLEHQFAGRSMEEQTMYIATLIESFGRFETGGKYLIYSVLRAFVDRLKNLNTKRREFEVDVSTFDAKIKLDQRKARREAAAINKEKKKVTLPGVKERCRKCNNYTGRTVTRAQLKREHQDDKYQEDLDM